MCFLQLPQEPLPVNILEACCEKRQISPSGSHKKHVFIQDALASRFRLGKPRCIHPLLRIGLGTAFFGGIIERKKSRLPFAVPCVWEILARGAPAGYDKLFHGFQKE